MSGEANGRPLLTQVIGFLRVGTAARFSAALSKAASSSVVSRNLLVMRKSSSQYSWEILNSFMMGLRVVGTASTFSEALDQLLERFDLLRLQGLGHPLTEECLDFQHSLPGIERL